MPATKRTYRISDIAPLLVPRIAEAQKAIAERERQAQVSQPNTPRYFDLKNIAESNPMPEPEKDTGFLGSAEYLAQSWIGGGLTGLAYEGLTGEQMFDLTDYDPNQLEQAAAGLLDFASPLDIGAMIVGGVAGKAVGKGIQLAGKPILEGALKQGIREGGAFAAQSAARQTGEDVVRGEGFNLPSTLAAGAKGLAIGGAAGLAGGSARMAVKGKVAGEVLGTGAEVAAFGGVAPVVEEGRAPTMDDFLHAGYAIAAFKVAGLAGSKVKGLYDRMATRDAKKVQEAVESGVPYEDAVADQLYGALEKKHDPAVLLKLSGAKEGEQIGTLGDLITDKGVRERYASELDIPILVDNGSNRFAGKADFAGRQIRINNALGDSKAVQLKTVFEEAEHFKDRRLGEGFTKYDPNKISEAEYNALPEEVRVRQSMDEFIAARKNEQQSIWETDPSTMPTRDIWNANPGGESHSKVVKRPVEVPSDTDPQLELLKNASRGQLVEEALRLGVPEDQAVRMTPQELRFQLSGGRLENAPVVSKPKVRTVKAETLNKAEKKALKIQQIKEQRAKVVVSNPLPKSLAAAVESKSPAGKKVYDVTEATDKTSLVGLIEKAEKEGAVVKPSAEFRMTEEFKQFSREGWVRYEKGQPHFVNPVKEAKALASEKYLRIKEGISDGNYGNEAFSIRFNLNKAMAKTGMRENAESVFKQIRRKIRDFTPDVAMQAENRVDAKTSKQVLRDIVSADNVAGRLAGTWLNEGFEAGLKRDKDLAWGQAMSLQMQGKAPMSAEAHAFRRIFDEAIDQARKPLSEGGAGMDIGKLPNYLPGFIKEEWAYKMFDDITALERELAGSKTVNDGMIIHNLKKKSSYLQDTVKAFVDGGMSYEKALRRVTQLVHSQLFAKESFERTRGGLELAPSQMWEDDFRKIFPAYVNSMAERQGQSMFFGQKGEKIVAALDKIRAEAPHEVPIVEEIYRQFTGAVNSDPTRKIRTKAAQKIVDFYTDYQGITKISLGTATFANFWQLLISTIPDLGVWNAVQGAIRLADPTVRSGIRDSGALKPDIMDAMLGARNKSMLSEVADKLATYSGFRPINKLWQYLAASTAEVAVKDWHRAAQGTGRKAEWARARLKDFSLDHTKPLERNGILEAMYRFSVDSQLQKNVLKDPLVFNDPKYRALFLFKRFGYRQFTYMKDMLIREGERGNYMPAVRLAVGGALGGTAAIAGFNAIRSMMSGQSYYYRQPDNALEDIYNKIAAIGAFGVMSDITRLDQQMTMADRLKFAATPVFWSDTEKAVEAYNNVARDWKRYGDAWLVTKRNAHSAFNVVGGNIAQASKRLLTDEQKKRGLARLKGNEKREIYLAILAGDGRLAADKIADWNRSNSGNAITMKDINIKEVSDFMKRELDAKLKAEGLSKEGEDAGEYRKQFREKRMEDLKRLKELRGSVTQAASEVR